MEETVPFASRQYAALFLVLLFARGMDFLSTWIATPHMVLEGNPIAKKLGWKWGIPINFLLCVGFAFWPVPAVVISTTSLLVAARNFQSAWLMRSMGEDAYREWYIARIQETRINLYLFCLAGQTFLTAAVGAALVWASIQKPSILLLPFSIGLGIIAYGGAVAIFTLLSVWRLRRADLQRQVQQRSWIRSPTPNVKELYSTQTEGK